MPSRTRSVNFTAVSSSRRAARWPALLLVPLCAALYGPGLFALPAVDRDESRYTQAARQMVASGDLVIPRIGSEARLIKPIGTYWLQAAAARLSGSPDAIGVYRLPSALAALAGVLCTYWIGRRFFAGAVAWLGAALLAASALLVVEAHLATTDAMLLACVVVAQGCLAALYEAVRRDLPPSPRAAAGFWIAQAAGVLVKGPVAPLVGALTIVTLMLTQRTIARRLFVALRPLWGLPLAAACVAPWLVAAGMRIGWRALPAAMLADIVPKMVGGHQSHGGLPGLYLLMAPATLWPGSLALAFALTMAWRRRRRPGERFLLAWLVPTWLFFELLPTKLPNYVLPTFPAFALLAARAALSAPARLRPPLRHPVTRLLVIGWALLTLAIGVAPLVAARQLGASAALGGAALAGLAAALIAALCLRYCGRGILAPAMWMAALGAVLVYAPLLQWTAPQLDPLWMSRAAAAAVARAGIDRRLAAVGYAEPSLRFLTRSDLALIDASAGAQFLIAHPSGLVFVAGDQLPAFNAAAAERGLALRNVWSERGFNYSAGEWTDLHLLTTDSTDRTDNREETPR